MRSRSHRGYNRNRRLNGGRLAFLTLLFWVVSSYIMISMINGGSTSIQVDNGERVARLYIGSIFPSISRGVNFESREAMGNNIESNSEIKDKNIFKTMVGSMFPAIAVLDDDLAEEDPGIIYDNSEFISGDTKDETLTSIIDTQTPDSPKPATANIDYSKPVVIIYHTHATESYQPVTEGNFHSLKEYGTVREVGNVLRSELEAKGIQVIHDKTIHDSPSYNQSYSRSLETIQKLMGDNSSAMIIVDLHRDAAGYSGNVAKTVTVNKDMAAKYSLVVGTGNPNVEALRIFANHINSSAEKLYPGFGGKIIEKQYKFNQYVSDYHILLEVGNNENTIEQAKVTGKYFADVLAAAIKEIE